MFVLILASCARRCCRSDKRITFCEICECVNKKVPLKNLTWRALREIMPLHVIITSYRAPAQSFWLMLYDMQARGIFFMIATRKRLYHRRRLLLFFFDASIKYIIMCYVQAKTIAEKFISHNKEISEFLLYEKFKPQSTRGEIMTGASR
jgi:hypothetical protein